MHFLFVFMNFHFSFGCDTLIPGTPPICMSPYNKSFYLQFEPYLPRLGSSWADDLQVYLPSLEPQVDNNTLYCKHDDSFSQSTHDLSNFDGEAKYFTWISQKYKVPILASMFAPACGDKCPQETGRGCSKFQTCELSNVTHTDYSFSELDRGHLVPNSALGDWYNTSASTFSMCNITPQSKRLNEVDWVALEHWIACLGIYQEFYVHTGPIFNDTAFDYCVCSGNEGGAKSCADCHAGTAVPIPSGFWKVLITPDHTAYSWIYTKAQEKCAADPEDPDCVPGNIIQTVDDAFDPNGLQTISKLVDFIWPPYISPASNMDELKKNPYCSY